MSILFCIYMTAFWFIHRRNRTAAILCLGVASLASVGMYVYHADSELGLNF